MDKQNDIEKIMGEISEKVSELDGDPDWKQKITSIVRRIIAEYAV